MLNFLKYVLATLVGLFLFIVLGFFLMAGIGALLGDGDAVVLKDNSVLRLDLERPIQEIVEENPFSEALAPFTGEVSSVSIKEVKDALVKAASDNKIKGVYLKAGAPASGWAVLEEVRDALAAFKASGKFVYAFAEGYSEKGYYLASVSDVIYLTEFGDFEWNGLSAEYDFYKGTLDKLEIKPEVFRVGEFKSAVEPFLRTDMSEASRLQARELLTGINDHFLGKIAVSRSVTPARLRDWADSLSIEKAGDALSRGLITHVGYYDQFESDLKAKLGTKESEKVHFTGLKNYLKSGSDKKEEGDFNKRVAVVIAEGEIVSGEGSENLISSGKLIKELKKVRENDKVKAVVLRINSPGGSALASDLIWREVKLTAEKKPVIASMGNVAASGGYYIAMGCDTIVAQPNTITGSIGIFGLMLNIEPFMKNKLGITFDRVMTNPHADWPTATRNMTDFEKQKIQRAVETGYEIFTSKAADGRKMSQSDLKKLAEGRVWSGVAAKSNGLVDVLGGVDTAIEIAAAAADLKKGDYRVRYYPEKKDWKQELMNSLTGSDDEETLSRIAGPLAPYAKAYRSLTRMEGIQARMPFEIRID
ncbi:MAG: signal peptide peptidase SppA [Cytophagaceae bacterium SCN 52-12]|nr:MAG: signal peptide peptidase SppA [Cytophagaceae bacterium SCN 52-12]